MNVAPGGRAWGEIGDVSDETGRMEFIGRGNTVADPQAMSGVTGALGRS
jgi:hypothetical protein